MQDRMNATDQGTAVAQPTGSGLLNSLEEESHQGEKAQGQKIS